MSNLVHLCKDRKVDSTFNVAMEIDSLLCLEEEFYEEGYKEGQAANLKKNYIEGKQFGLQVGFQKFCFVGMILGVCDTLRFEKLSDSSRAQCVVLKSMINSLQLDNSESNVLEFDKQWPKIANKFRSLIMSLNRTTFKLENKLEYNKLEQMCKLIAGEMKAYVEDRDVGEAKMTQDASLEW